jgi:hypothetical protein
MLPISDKAIISKLADIEDSARGTRIIIEEGVRVHSFVKIKPAVLMVRLLDGLQEAFNFPR